MRHGDSKRGNNPLLADTDTGIVSLANKGQKVGAPFRTSATLVGNMLPDLSARQEEGLTIYSRREDATSPAFSVFEQRVIMCLEKLLHEAITNGGGRQQKRAQEAVERLTIDRLNRRGYNYIHWGNYVDRENPSDQEEAGRPRVAVKVSLRHLAQELYNVESNRLGGWQVDNVKNALRKISDQWFLWRYAGVTGKGKKLDLKIESRLIDATFLTIDEDGKKTQYVEIEYKDMWLYQLNSKYVLTPFLLEETGNCLFVALFQKLRMERGYRVNGAKGTGALEKKFRKEHAEQLGKEEEKELQKLLTDRLTCKLPLYNFCEEIPEYTQERNGKKYLRKERIKSDLKKAVEELKQVGIIKDFYTIEERKKVTCCFVISENWVERAEGQK